MTAKMLIAGNWKMNGLSSSLTELKEMAKGLQSVDKTSCDALICLPATLISRGAEAVKGSALAIGGEDCHFNDSGAHTGDVSAPMVKDAGASHVIVGHSERRADHGETDQIVRQKAEAAWRSGLTAVLCVGETLEQRENGTALDVVGKQCAASIPEDATPESLVVAYEPIWAIGTGKVPTADDVAEMHSFIQKELEKRFGGEGSKFRILYGGSVKPSNAATLLAVPHVHGALIGGASLKATDFLGILSEAAKL